MDLFIFFFLSSYEILSITDCLDTVPNLCYTSCSSAAPNSADGNIVLWCCIL